MFKKAIKEALREVLDIRDEKVTYLKDIEAAKNELNSLKKQLTEKEIALEKLRSLKETEELEMQHATRMIREKDGIELEKKTQAIVAAYRDKEAELHKEYRDKISAMQEDNMEDMKDMYNKISETLANAVSVDITKDR